jgi:hypothetical protein
VQEKVWYPDLRQSVNRVGGSQGWAATTATAAVACVAQTFVTALFTFPKCLLLILLQF